MPDKTLDMTEIEQEAYYDEDEDGEAIVLYLLEFKWYINKGSGVGVSPITPFFKITLEMASELSQVTDNS